MNHYADLPHRELLRHTGQISQVAGLTRFTYADGNARGLPAIQVKNGSGLAFVVLEGRNLDLYNLEYKGINLAFFYKNGLTVPERMCFGPNEFLGQASGGMIHTAGLQNCGPQNEAEGLFQPLHGRISPMGADHVCSRAWFDEDGRYRIELSGRTRESRLFQHNLTLSRRITTELNANHFTLQDTIENETCREDNYSILYHVNFGYPFLDEGTEIVVSDRATSVVRDAWSEQHIADRFKMSAPIDNFPELLYYHTLPADELGICTALVVNDKLNLAVELTFAKANLPYLVEWKSMGSGDYALGVMPSSSLLRGRCEELAAGGLNKLAAFDRAETGLTFKIIEGAEAIAARAGQVRGI